MVKAPQKQWKDPVRPGAMQFSLHGMFWIVTLIAFYLSIMITIQRWRVDANASSEKRRVEDIAAAREDTARTILASSLKTVEINRAILEADRDKLPPGYYEKARIECDQHEAEAKAVFEGSMKKLRTD